MNKCSYPEAVVRLLDSYRQVKRERKRDMRKKEKTGSVSAYMNQFGKYFRKTGSCISFSYCRDFY